MTPTQPDQPDATDLAAIDALSLYLRQAQQGGLLDVNVLERAREAVERLVAVHGLDAPLLGEADMTARSLREYVAWVAETVEKYHPEFERVSGFV